MASEQIDPLAPATVVQHFDPGFDHDLGEYATGADYRLLYAEVEELRADRHQLAKALNDSLARERVQREQLEKADRLADVAGPAVECGRGTAGQCRTCAALDEALAAYEAARKEEGK